MALSRANGVAGFVRRNGIHTDTLPAYTIQDRYQPASEAHLEHSADKSPATKAPATSSRRELVGSMARIKQRPIKLERSQPLPRTTSSDSLSVANSGAGKDMPAHGSADVLIKQEYLQHHIKGSDMFDTDVEGFDDTTATSHELFADDGRSEAVPFTESASQYECLEGFYEADGTRKNDSLYERNYIEPYDKNTDQSRNVAESDDDYQEEETGSDASDEEVAENVNPTLDSAGMHAFIHPGEMQDFQQYQSQMNHRTLPVQNVSALSTYTEAFQAQNGSQGHYLEEDDEYRSRSASRPASRPATYSGREKGQPFNGSGGGPLSQPQNLHREVTLPRHPKALSSVTRADSRTIDMTSSSHPKSQTISRNSKKESLEALKPSQIDSSVQNAHTTWTPPSTELQRSHTEQGGFNNGEHLQVDQKEQTRPMVHLLPVIAQSSRKRDAGLDYSKEQLSKMPYSQLKSESFDHDPKGSPFVLPEEVRSQPIPKQFSHFSDLKNVTEEFRSEQQRAFFSSLTIDKYEECGDLILGRFSDILASFKDARQEKRRVAKEFEEEISVRGERVRGRSELIDKKLAKLREAGEGVIKGQGS